jgi:Leucine-rich repeat (LRR) protein
MSTFLVSENKCHSQKKVTRCLWTVELGTFAHSSTSKTLELESNQLISCSPLTDKFSRLRDLSFAENQLKSLSKRVFFGLSALINLDLSFNKIETIENGAFDGLVNLKSLNLCGNAFVSLDMSLLNKPDLVMLCELGVYGFVLRSTDKKVESEFFNFISEFYKKKIDVAKDGSSLIDALAKKGFLQPTYSNLAKMRVH